MVVVSPAEQRTLLSFGWRHDAVPAIPTIEVTTRMLQESAKKSRMWAILMSDVFRPMHVSVQLSGTSRVK